MGKLIIWLMLVQRDAEVFYLTGEPGRRRCPRLVIGVGRLRQTDLRTAVVEAARSQLHLDISYFGVLAVDEAAEDLRLFVGAETPPVNAAARGAQRLTSHRVEDLPHLTGDLPGEGVFTLALQRRTAESTAGALGLSLRRAVEGAVDYLDAHVSVESGMQGWNQYQDGRTIGVLSTAQALLSHVYAGSRVRIVDAAGETLGALQNPDGGWQIRRALVGALSDVSITESTAYCLMALSEAGRGDDTPAVQRGLAWLETAQQADGGWKSSAADSTSNVVATAWAVRVLATLGRTTPARRGVEWLRTAQNADGGWGPVARHPRSAAADAESTSSPAYTAHALLALLSQGVDPGERHIVRGCAYLDGAFDPAREEPWTSTSFTTVVDNNSFARLDFRHFATPWALAALSATGRDLSDPTLLHGTLKLLRMQTADGAWRSGLTAPGDFPVWACHDALFALRSITARSAERLDAVALSAYHERQLEALEKSLGKRISSSAAPLTSGARSYVTTAWLSLLTVFVVLLAFRQLNIIGASGGSALGQLAKWVGTAVVAAVGALAPPVVVEEYKIRRQQNQNSAEEEYP
ncbi:prenyltransferase/squalene oxidase repeat-containing protein [Actinacidiphila sp. ITFR-21]|uniref:prenyltransferase/squalene oxidase repeat-containing protein n=1 Tax=Actinacidiphila sp. ITFR-21 TaxID=3075199 RepID=UPI00288C41C8|nr:prenyltransferase/squalene oxidase repeat-containing protein [Streptomyces sp. ITFR-21]WNI15295.1 prenyltransferase/squalene oxidase repeat-containing protein [Streptomyces sp. ITFR-21]